VDEVLGLGGRECVVVLRVLLVESAVSHDVDQLRVVLQHGDVSQQFTIDQVAGLDLSQLVGRSA
jgi:hypothetical protein